NCLQYRDFRLTYCFLFDSSAALLVLPSFPTRRSSDLLIGVTGLQHRIQDRYALFQHRRCLPCPFDLAYIALRQPRNPQEAVPHRSEEHTSELQSRSDLVCRLLLEKKNQHCPTTSKRPN